MSSSVPVVLKPTGAKKRKYDPFEVAEPSVPRGALPPAAKLKRDNQAEFDAAAKPLPSHSELIKQNESLNRMISELQAKNEALEQTALKIYLEARDVGAEVEIPQFARNWGVRYANLNGCDYRRVEHDGGAVILYYKNESSNKWVVCHYGVQDILMKASWLGVGHW